MKLVDSERPLSISTVTRRPWHLALQQHASDIVGRELPFVTLCQTLCYALSELLSRAKSVELGIPHQKIHYPIAKAVLRRVRAADAVDHLHLSPSHARCPLPTLACASLWVAHLQVGFDRTQFLALRFRDGIQFLLCAQMQYGRLLPCLLKRRAGHPLTGLDE